MQEWENERERERGGSSNPVPSSLIHFSLHSGPPGKNTFPSRSFPPSAEVPFTVLADSIKKYGNERIRKQAVLGWWAFVGDFFLFFFPLPLLVEVGWVGTDSEKELLAHNGIPSLWHSKVLGGKGVVFFLVGSWTQSVLGGNLRDFIIIFYSFKIKMINLYIINRSRNICYNLMLRFIQLKN